jgi:hypothetical protein
MRSTLEGWGHPVRIGLPARPVSIERECSSAKPLQRALAFASEGGGLVCGVPAVADGPLEFVDSALPESQDDRVMARS